MKTNSRQIVCAISQTGFRNLVIATDKVGECAQNLADIGRREQIPSSSIELLMKITSAAENGSTLLKSFLLNGNLDDQFADSHDPGSDLKNLLFGISESVSLIANLREEIETGSSPDEIDAYMKDLIYFGASVRELISGMLCYDVVGTRKINCQNSYCVVREWTLGLKNNIVNSTEQDKALQFGRYLKLNKEVYQKAIS